MRKLAALVTLGAALYLGSHLASRTPVRTEGVEERAFEECSCPASEEESDDILIGDDVEGDELALPSGYYSSSALDCFLSDRCEFVGSETYLITPNGEGLMCYDARFPISSCDSGIAIPLDNPVYFTLQDCGHSLLQEDRAEQVRGALEVPLLENSYFKMLLKENAY